MRKLVALPLLIALFPVCVQERRVLHQRVAVPEAWAGTSLHALEDYEQDLLKRGEFLDNQGILIESVDGFREFASLNPDVQFNPASVMKLATTLVALYKLSPGYRFRTNFLIDGAVDSKTRRVEGDLVVDGGFDPMFALQDVQQVAEKLARAGVSHVSGSLRISGAFYYFATGYHSNLSRETSAVKLRSALERAGIRIEGPTVFGATAGKLLLAHYSDQLLRILLYQNAHSSNAIAEVVGEAIGGPDGIQRTLARELYLVAGDVYVGSASGLGFNRMTPRTSLRILRALIDRLSDYGLKPEDIMPVAGIDSGTLRDRFAAEGLRGVVVAKTGTLSSFDNGVSTLVGVINTRENGLQLFAIFNSSGNVVHYRRAQDRFLRQLIDEMGGGVAESRTEDALSTAQPETINQLFLSSFGSSNKNLAAD